MTKLKHFSPKISKIWQNKLSSKKSYPYVSVYHLASFPWGRVHLTVHLSQALICLGRIWLFLQCIRLILSEHQLFPSSVLILPSVTLGLLWPTDCVAISGFAAIAVIKVIVMLRRRFSEPLFHFYETKGLVYIKQLPRNVVNATTPCSL